MQANEELLNFVYQNTQMGVNTLQQLLEIVEEQELHAYLQKQLAGYRDFLQRTVDLLHQHDMDEEGIGALAQLGTYLMINLKTLTDSSPSHIAEMLILGSNMGIIEAVRTIHQYSAEADVHCLGLMRELKAFEEANVERLKCFL
jgi:hypothetical protein